MEKFDQHGPTDESVERELFQPRELADPAHHRMRTAKKERKTQR
jgi:hypothetical protein